MKRPKSHGGKRKGAGRKRRYNVTAQYSVPVDVVVWIDFEARRRKLAREAGATKSSVVTDAVRFYQDNKNPPDRP
jgi:hypothetical protein